MPAGTTKIESPHFPGHDPARAKHEARKQMLTGQLPRRCSFYLASDLPYFRHLLRREYRLAESCDRDVFLYWTRHVHAALYSPSVVDKRALVNGL